MRHFDNSINSVQAPEGWGTQLGHVGTTWDMLRTRLDSVITSNQVGVSPFLSNLLPAFTSTPDELGNLFVGYLYTLDMTLCHTLVYTHISYMYIYIHGYTRPHPHTHTYIYTYTANFKNNGAATVQVIYDLPCYPNVSSVDSKNLMDFLGPFPQVDVAIKCWTNQSHQIGVTFLLCLKIGSPMNHPMII